MFKSKERDARKMATILARKFSDSRSAIYFQDASPETMIDFALTLLFGHEGRADLSTLVSKVRDHNYRIGIKEPLSPSIFSSYEISTLIVANAISERSRRAEEEMRQNLLISIQRMMVGT